jgi:serine/threonine-protein kinase RIO1
LADASPLKPKHLIDFPHSVEPRFNANARSLLGRDVANMCRY